MNARPSRLEAWASATFLSGVGGRAIAALVLSALLWIAVLWSLS